MTPADRVAAELAACFPINARLLARAPAFRVAVDAALAMMQAADLVSRVVDAGGLGGARNPYGVIIVRVRRVAEDYREEQAQRAVARVPLRPGEPRLTSIGEAVVVAPRGVARGAR